MKLGEIKRAPQGQLSAAAERRLTIRLPAFLSLTKPTSLPREWRVGEVQEAHWPLQIILILLLWADLHWSAPRIFMKVKIDHSWTASLNRAIYCASALVEVHWKATGRCPVALDLTPYYTSETEGTHFTFWSLFRLSFQGKLIVATKQKTKQGKELGNWETEPFSWRGKWRK